MMNSPIRINSQKNRNHLGTAMTLLASITLCTIATQPARAEAFDEDQLDLPRPPVILKPGDNVGIDGRLPNGALPQVNSNVANRFMGMD